MKTRLDNPKKTPSARRKRPHVLKQMGKNYVRSDGKLVIYDPKICFNWEGVRVNS